MNKIKINNLLLPWMEINYQYTINGIECDSRLIKPGNIFCAIQGENIHGKNFILNSINKGAKIVLYDTKKKTNMVR